MKTRTRRRQHIGLALFFAVQVPVAVYLQFEQPHIFATVWKTYLIFISLYAVISTHWAGASAETPTKED